MSLVSYRGITICTTKMHMKASVHRHCQSPQDMMCWKKKKSSEGRELVMLVMADSSEGESTPSH